MDRTTQWLLLALAAQLLLSCATKGQPDFKAQEPTEIDGVRNRSPGQAEMLRNTSNSFRL